MMVVMYITYHQRVHVQIITVVNASDSTYDNHQESYITFSQGV